MELQKVYTIHGEAIIDLKEIIGVFPKATRDSFPYIMFRCGEKIYFNDYHLQQLKQVINTSK